MDKPPKPTDPTIPSAPLPGQKPEEKSPVSQAMLDCKNWPKQEEKVMGFGDDEEKAFKYISGDGMLALGVLIPRMLGKEARGMRPDTFVLLLKKLSTNHLKTVFENIKETNNFHLLQEIAKRDSSLVGDLGALKRKSGVNFEESEQVDAHVKAWSREKERIAKIAEEQRIENERMERKITELRQELKELGHTLVPTQADGEDMEEVIADLEAYKKFIWEVEADVAKNDKPTEEDLEQQQDVECHVEEDVDSRHRAVFDKKGKVASTNVAIMAQNAIRAKVDKVFKKLKKYFEDKKKKFESDKKSTDKIV